MELARTLAEMRSGMEMSDWLNVELRRETESSMMVGVANVRYKPRMLLLKYLSIYLSTLTYATTWS